MFIPSFALAALAASCAAPSTKRPSETPAVAVSTATAALTDVASSFEAGGVVRARSTAAIASRVMAPIVDIAVRPGDRVRRGAVLVTLDARELTASRARAAAALTSAEEAARAAESDIRAADAAVTLARTTYDRTRTLREQRSATLQELDQATEVLETAEAHLRSSRARTAAATAARDAAQAALEGATVASSYGVLTAPFDGLVTERSVDSGSMANPGVTLLTLEDPTAFRLEVPLDEARAAQIEVGQQAQVFLGAGVQDVEAPRMTGQVREVARVDPTAYSFLVKLELPSAEGLRSGTFGRARFMGPPRRALTIPASTTLRRGQLTFAFVVSAEKRARLQPLSLGEAAGDRIEVLAGLREGDRVVVSPPAMLGDGMPVTGDVR
jgi:RND family efflux transporter MFP subunit